MKIGKFVLTAAVAATFVACGSDPKPNEVNPTEAQPVAEANDEAAAAATWNVDTAASELKWMGAKVAYSHAGIINITSGTLNSEGDNLTAGNFVVDMTTIVDNSNPDTAAAAQLAGHLMSPDFFNVAQYPTTTFEITGVEANAADTVTHTISGNLTIMDTTNNISFPANISMDGGTMNATAIFTINRNDWGVVYGSGLSGAVGDNIIKDEITFDINLVATKSE